MRRVKKNASNRPVLAKSVQPIFQVVGIGASAGGLEAYIQIFTRLSGDTGLAFVLVQHLSLQSKGTLAKIIQNVTKMSVIEEIDQIKVKPNHIYICPPNVVLEIFHGVLHVSPMSFPHSSNFPIDQFLTSLARDQGRLAVGVVLSGTGSDGALGIRAIQSEGGTCLVQDPSEAKFDGMPRAAMVSLLPDQIMPVAEITRELIRVARNPSNHSARLAREVLPSSNAENYLQKIFILLRSVTRIDFSVYKSPTIVRRIKRRMVLHQIETLQHFYSYLQKTPAEVQMLFEDLLINVTQFFRDPEAFEALKINVFPELLKNRPPGATIRIWVPGCATGEEVYSIAIVLLEVFSTYGTVFPIQIYGTDICESAIQIARAGYYSETALSGLGKNRIQEFFVKEPAGYRISKLVRDCCIFSLQDITSQPPINRLDLLSCRNLMIYLGAKIQKKVMETFHFSLNARGFLVLGSSETAGSAPMLFSVFDKKNKIYRKKPSFSLPALSQKVGVLPQWVPTVALGREYLIPRVAKPLDAVAEAERKVLNEYSPAWLLINQSEEVVQFGGATENFIDHAPDTPSWSLRKIVKSGLSSDVRILVSETIKKGSSHKRVGLKVRSGGMLRKIDVESSIIGTAGKDAYLLLVFLEREKIPLIESASKMVSDRKSVRGQMKKSRGPMATEILGLKTELANTQKSLQSIIDDQGLINEEMQTANEEVLSANEELQSTNEEMETAKEELESTNEELITLNEELSGRNTELSHLSNDLVNVLENVNVAIVMVGPDLRIRRFTPMAEKLLGLIPADVGRDLLDFNLGIMPEDLAAKFSEVIKLSSTVEFEMSSRTGVLYSVRIRPYKTIELRTDGAVLVFFNIDEAKRRENASLADLQYSNSIIETVRDPILILDESCRVERANQAFYDTFKMGVSETIGFSFYELGSGQWNILELRRLIDGVLSKSEEVLAFPIEHVFEKLGTKVISVDARNLLIAGKRKLLILISMHDLARFSKSSEERL